MAKNNKDRKTMSSEMGIPSGLNPIKTRSGPLKDVETHTIGIRSLDASLTSQQLSNMSGAESRSQNRASTKDFSAAPPTQTAPRATSSARPGGEMIIADTGKSSGQHLKGKISHRFAAYLDKECSRNIDSFPKDSENYNVAANNLNQKDVVAEKPPQQSFQKKKFPKGFKSYSHELGPRGGMRPVCPRAHSDNDLKELLGALHARFNTAKEEVNSELAVFAGDVVEVLEKKDSLNPEWQENIEDLLILARECAVMPPTEFRRQCEGIVQDLEDKRQQLPVGLLKQLHTHMLFILTRCTRLLQFQKESGPNQEDSIHKFKQCLKGVPSVEMGWVPSSSKKSKVVADSAKFRKHEDDLRNRIDGDELTTSSGKQTVGTDSAGLHDVLEYSITTHRFPAYSKNDSLAEDYIGLEKKMTSLPPQGQIKSPETYTVDPSELLANTVPEDKPFVVWDENSLSQESGAQSCSPSKQQYKATWGFVHDQQANIEELESVICRICEEEVPTSHLESHSYICAYADRCDLKGLNVDERLAKMAETLEQIVESCRVSLDSPETTKVQNVHSTDGFESYSPRLSDWHRKGVEGMFEDLHEIDTASIEESRIPSSNNLKGHFALRFEQGFASSSAGSVTPRSAINTPRANQIDLFWLERSNLTEAEDVAQMTELADIARCVASTNPKDEGATEYLTACMQDLQDILQHSKVEALVVETFGSRIEKLLREKYLLACETLDHKSFDPSSTLQEDEGSLADEGSHSIMSTPAHPAHKERTSIDDFEIIKPISRGAFGKVFLARKRTTGDLFAIKVLRKVDMIRKNAVESILAERNILITVRNPFVVRFFYSFTCRDNLYLVMEYLNGGDLYSLLRNVGCLEEEIARIYIAELVLALEYLHSLGIVHRDLKPDNILIAHDGHIKLTDFGLSKFGLINSTEDLAGPGASGSMLLGDHSCQSSSENVHYREQRKQRSAVGTPDYLAPEILLGTEHGYTADWWSTGIILFEILTGIPPFSAEHPQIIFDKILNRKIPWPRVPDDMSYEAKDLIDKLLTEDPNLRLGAKGASEVKAHPFFDNVNWDTLAMQKAAFVPSPESADDTSYFTCRPSQNSYTIQEYPESSDCSTSTTSSNSLNIGLEEGVDECGDLTEFDCPSSVKYTFSNFSFKNLSQLALINYDLLLQSGKDSSKSSSPSKGPES